MDINFPSIHRYDAAWSLGVALISSFFLFIITGLGQSVLAGAVHGMLYYYDKKQQRYHASEIVSESEDK